MRYFRAFVISLILCGPTGVGAAEFENVMYLPMMFSTLGGRNTSTAGNANPI